MVLTCVKRDATGGQTFGHVRVPLPRRGFVIMIREDGGNAQLCGELRDCITRGRVPHEQRAATHGQAVGEFCDAVPDEFDPPVILRRQSIEDLAVENERAMDPLRGLERVI